MSRHSQTANPPSAPLPVTRDLGHAYACAAIVAVLVAAVSIGGLLFPFILYPTDDVRQSFLANDVVNLVLGIPILLASMWLARRGQLVGLLCWPGALLYAAYNSIGYLFGMPVGPTTFAYLALVLLSAWTIYGLLKCIDSKTVQQRLSGAVPAGASGWVLVLFGVAFASRAAGILAEASTGQTPLPAGEFGVLIADTLLSTLWVVGGIFLIRRTPLGYASGLGLLFAGCALFVALILFLLLQPVITAATFDPAGVLVVFAMGLVCFVPAGLFVRGVLSKGRMS